MSLFWREVRYSVRVLGRRPGLCAATVLCLALGIGGVTAVLSVFSGMFVHLLPYEDNNELVVFETRMPGIDRAVTSTTAAFYHRWSTEADCFAGLGAYMWHASHDPYEGWKDTDERFKDLGGFHITPSLPSVLGIKPRLGRFLDETETRFEEHPVVILSHHAWHDRFGADPYVVGQPVRLDGQNCRIIGVLPPNMRFLPCTMASLIGTFSCNNSADYWIPMPEKFHKIEEVDFSFDVVGRIRKGQSLAAAQSQIDVLGERLFEQYIRKMGIKSIATRIIPLRQYVLGTVQTGLWLLLAAAGFVLLIACANVANLLLIHNLSRVREMAVCSALGGTRWRWLRQRLMDSLLIALGGGLLGILLALWGTRLLAAVAPADLPGLDQIRMNPAVLGATLLVSLLCGLIVGLLPAWRMTRSNLFGLLKGISWSSSTVGAKERRTFGVLGMVEVALALVLLLGATLTLRSFWRLMQVELGVDTDNIVCARLMGPDLTEHYATLLDDLQGLPGVEAATTVTALPLTNEMSDFAIVRPLTGEQAKGDTWPEVSLRGVSRDYFQAMGIQLLQGRAFTAHDNKESDHVAVVNQRLAGRLWPDVNPIGQQLRFEDVLSVLGTGGEDKSVVYRVIGIIQDIKYRGPEAGAPMEVYLPMAQGFRPYVGASLALRCRSASTAYAEVVRRRVEAACPGCSVTGFATMRDFLAQRTSARRFVMTLLLTFAGIALSLAVIGIYSVTAYTVSARMREVGIRMAFGADHTDVLRLVVKQGMRWVLAGLALGLVLSLVLHPIIASQLFGVSVLDPIALGAGLVLIVLISLTACLIPARRAAKVDPMDVLRYE